jgi:putative flippase GtrA
MIDMTFMYQLKKWLTAPVDNVLLQIPRALVASGLAAALDFGLLLFLVELLGWHPIPAATVGYFTGGLLQYALCALWVFPASPSNNTTGFLAFTLLSLVGLAITWTVMALMYDLGHLPYLLAKVVALGLAFGWNFLSRKFLLFRRSAGLTLPATP